MSVDSARNSNGSVGSTPRPCRRRKHESFLPGRPNRSDRSDRPRRLKVFLAVLARQGQKAKIYRSARLLDLTNYVTGIASTIDFQVRANRTFVWSKVSISFFGSRTDFVFHVSSIHDSCFRFSLLLIRLNRSVCFTYCF